MLTNNILKFVNKLQQKKYRRQYGEFLVEGVKNTKEALQSLARVNLVIIEGKQRDKDEFKEILKLADKKEVPVEFCARKDIGQIKTTDTFPGVLTMVEQPDYILDDIINNKPVICLDGLKDPGNLGTIIRTADWFGLDGLILSPDCVDLYNPKAVRSTMGSIFRVKIFQSKDLIKTLHNLKEKHSYELIGLTIDGKDVRESKAKANYAYILGSESYGLKKEIEKLVDKRYTIQGKGKAESLNVAVAAGILLNQI